MRRLPPLEIAVLRDLDEDEVIALRLHIGARLDATAAAELWRRHSFGVILEQAGGSLAVLRSGLIAVLRARRAGRV